MHQHINCSKMNTQVVGLLPS